MKKIKKFGIEMDWNVAFNKRSKGNKHLFRVRKIALYLAEKEGGRKDIIEAAVWLHDVGLIKGNKNHHKTGAKIAKRFLKNIGLDSKLIEQVCHCIEAHEGTVKAKTKEAMIVNDADALDKTGALGVIRHTWKLAQYYPTEKIAKILIKTKIRRKIYTKTAKKLAKKNNIILEEFLRKLKEQLNLRYLE